MPLPWLIVFFLIFISYYMIYLYLSSFYFSVISLNKTIKSSPSKLTW